VPNRNLEIVRRLYAHWEQGDFASVADSFNPDIRFESFMPDANEVVVIEGVDAVEAFTRDWFTQWREYRVTGEEFREVGDDVILVSGRQSAVGRHSGVVVESPASRSGSCAREG
jgi:ketosteroid isomerase-like protein